MTASQITPNENFLRRKFSRYNTIRDINLQFDGRKIGIGQIRDVSLTGAKLYLPAASEIPSLFEIDDPVTKRVRSVQSTWLDERLVGMSYVSPFESIGDLLHYRLSLFASCKSCGHSDWINLHSLAEKFGINFVCTEINLHGRIVCKQCRSKDAPLGLNVINKHLRNLTEMQPSGYFNH